MRRKTVTTIETHECWIVKRPGPERPTVFCPACPGDVAMLTPQEGAEQAGVSQRTVYHWVDEGLIHFLETAAGDLFVCLAPLTLDVKLNPTDANRH